MLLGTRRQALRLYGVLGACFPSTFCPERDSSLHPPPPWQPTQDWHWLGRVCMRTYPMSTLAPGLPVFPALFCTVGLGNHL